MLNVSRPWSASSIFLCLIFTSLFISLPARTARAQAAPVVTPLGRLLSHLDLGVAAVGQITGDVAGNNYLNQPISQKASTTVGVLVSLRYTKSPFIGFEGNYTQARYTENYSSYIFGGAQTKASEYSLGYVAHLPSLLGLQPFAAAGAGAIAFRPTAGGGQGLPAQARMVYYYNIGVDDALFSKHFGVRASLRQAFFKAPDFGQNYLTINQHTNTLEPTIGFYIKF
jgi:hypothetical protein